MNCLQIFYCSPFTVYCLLYEIDHSQPYQRSARGKANRSIVACSEDRYCHGTVQRWEKGEQVPDSNYLMRIAKATGVASHWLLTGEGEMFLPEPIKGIVHPLPMSRYRKLGLTSLPLLSSVPGGALRQTFHPDHTERHVTVDDVRDPAPLRWKLRGTVWLRALRTEM